MSAKCQNRTSAMTAILQHATMGLLLFQSALSPDAIPEVPRGADLSEIGLRPRLRAQAAMVGCEARCLRRAPIPLTWARASTSSSQSRETQSASAVIA